MCRSKHPQKGSGEKLFQTDLVTAGCLWWVTEDGDSCCSSFLPARFDLPRGHCDGSCPVGAASDKSSVGLFSRWCYRSVTLCFFVLVEDEASAVTVFLHLDLQILINAFLSRFSYFSTAAAGRGAKNNNNRSFIYISRDGVCRVPKGGFGNSDSECFLYSHIEQTILSHHMVRRCPVSCVRTSESCLEMSFLLSAGDHFARGAFNLFGNFKSRSAQKLKMEPIKMHLSAVSILIFLFSVTVRFT